MKTKFFILGRKKTKLLNLVRTSVTKLRKTLSLANLSTSYMAKQGCRKEKLQLPGGRLGRRRQRRRRCRTQSGGGRRSAPPRRDRPPCPTTPCDTTSPPRRGKADAVCPQRLGTPPPPTTTATGRRRGCISTPPLAAFVRDLAGLLGAVGQGGQSRPRGKAHKATGPA